MVEDGQGVDAGSGNVVPRPRLGVGDPQREPARGAYRLDVATVGMRLAGVPPVDDLAVDADRGLFAPVGFDDRAVIFGETFFYWGSTLMFSQARFLRISAQMSLSGKIKPDCPNLFR